MKIAVWSLYLDPLLTPFRIQTGPAGTSYGMARRIFLSDLGLSRTKPPWEEIAAIDLTSGLIRWSKQHIASAVGGHHGIDSSRDDSLMGFTLDDRISMVSE
ncbi:MAG: hypothetical protein QGH99_10065, partial [Pseudomonadales bacterium]|nr:hypothetical protein [Pseudomonadales bacterium]